MSVFPKSPRRVAQRGTDGRSTTQRRATKRGVVATAAGAAVLLGLAPFVAASSASAATPPSNSAAQAAAPTAVDAPGTLSIPASTTVPADGGTVFTNLQIPAGLTPTSVTGQIVPTAVTAPAAANTATGTLQVSVNGVVLQTLDPTQPGTLNVPLTASDVVGGVVSVGLTYSTQNATDQVCTVPSTASVTLSDVVLQYSGSATPPSTVADFLSPSLKAVSVVIPDAPSTALEEAGLATVASLAHALPSSVDISLTTATDTADAAAVDPIRGRVISITPSTDASIATATTALSTTSAGVPELTITGPETTLSAAGTALGSDYLVLANSGTTTGLSQTGTTTPALSQNLSYFGAGTQIALSGYGQTSSFTNIPQSSFGGPISSATLNLVGTHSDIPDSVIATMNVYWNNYLIGSQVLGHSTAVDMTLQVPGTQLTSANGLKIQLSAAPVTGDCMGPALIIPIQLFVDSKSSTVVAARGQSIDPGFSRFPQVLGGVLPVAFGTGVSASAGVAAAGDVVASVQRNSSIQLTVSVVTPNAFMSSSQSGLFVGATSADSDALQSPLRLDSFKAIDSNAVSFGVGTTQPYAALQSFQTGGRNILMLGGWSPTPSTDAATAGSSSATDALQLQAADYTVTNPNGWFGMSGDVLIAQPNQSDPVLISSNAIVPQTARTDDYRGYAIWIAIIAIVLIVAGVIGEVVRRRRRAKLKTYVDAQLAAESAAGAGSDAGSASAGSNAAGAGPSETSTPE